MRKLMWFTIGVGIASGIGAYLLSGDALAALSVAALILTGAVWVAGKRWKQMLPGAVVCLGLAVGLLWFWIYDGWYWNPVRELDGITTQASFEITDFSFDARYGISADGNASWQGKTYHVRLYLDSMEHLMPGDVVSGNFRFRTTGAGGAHTATYHRGEGIELLAYQRGNVAVERNNASWWQYPAPHLRRVLLENIKTVFPEDTESFARALLLGDDNDLSYTVNTNFKVSGIRHIVAVSGLHVSILFGFIYLVSGKRRVLTACLGMPVLFLFAAVAGFTPSVTRACIMHGLMMAALLFEREYDPLTALAFSALVMLTVNPLVITSVSFQLSVSSMAGILLFAERIKNWLLDEKHLGHKQGKGLRDRAVRAFAGTVSVSLGAVSLSTPLSAWYFGTVSLIAPLTNLLTLWVVTVVFYGIMAVCVLSLLWAQGAVALAWLVSWPIRYILAITDILAKIPLAAVYTRCDGVVLWLVFCYVLFAVFLLMKNRKPLIFSCVAVMGLCAVLLYSWLTPMTDSFRMTVLDVGQGQSIILQGGGKTFLVDCGGDYPDHAADTAAETLLSMGIRRIDGMILTHYDADHAGGAEYLLTRIQSDALFLPSWEETQTDSQLQGWNGGTVYSVEENLELSWPGGKLSIVTSDIRGSNESSLCVLFQAANCDILITGDRGSLGEKLLMQEMELPELDVLVVGHHGSKDSATAELLEMTKPQIAVISVGADNSYGHPTQETIDRLLNAGCMVLRTDWDGTIIIRR